MVFEKKDERSRYNSASDPLLPETIQFIKKNLQQSNYNFEIPHVFVVFGASVGLFLINFILNIKKCCLFNFQCNVKKV